MFDMIALDADDTLWHNESFFKLTEARFCELVAPYVTNGHNGAGDLQARLFAVETRNLALFGYGVNAFTLSMIETAIEVTDGTVPATVLRQLLDAGKEMRQHPVELLPGVAEAVEELASAGYRLMVITKGDLLHQESKVAASGLGVRFSAVEIVSEKDEETYRKVLARHGVAPERFLMVGNSLRSDVLPVLAIGGHAVHVPHEYVWAHEHVDGVENIVVLPSLAALPGWIAALAAR